MYGYLDLGIHHSLGQQHGLQTPKRSPMDPSGFSKEVQSSVVTQRQGNPAARWHVWGLSLHMLQVLHTTPRNPQSHHMFHHRLQPSLLSVCTALLVSLPHLSITHSFIIVLPALRVEQDGWPASGIYQVSLAGFCCPPSVGWGSWPGWLKVQNLNFVISMSCQTQMPL